MVKVRHLRKHWANPGTCQTCGHVFDRIQMLKADATAFFKSVRRKRCLDEVREAVQQMQRMGAKGFLLHRELKTRGSIHWGRRAVPRTHQLIPFDELLRSLVFIDSDRFFTVGTSVFERTDGLAMGNSTSPGLTAFDLDFNSRRIYRSREAAQQAGCHVPHMDASRCVQGLLHVDDAWVASKVFCNTCLSDILKRCWPEDVGAKIEEVGHEINFLHTKITAEANCIHNNRITVTLQIPNEK